MKSIFYTIYKNIFFLLLSILLLLNCKKDITGDIIVFDINEIFPVKTLDIEDVAEIEYLILDISDDEYLFRFFYTMTDSFIICEAKNNFLFFSRETGKPVSKVDRHGNGPGEYGTISRLPVYSELQNELFFCSSFHIFVYGRDGTFKRKFPIFKPTFFTSALYDFDDEHLLMNGFPLGKIEMPDTSFLLISKKDGLAEVIKIPFEKRINFVFMQGIAGTVADTYFAVRNEKDYLLTDYSSDTVYRFTPERQLTPILVRRPPIQEMETKIFLHSWL